MNKLSLCVIVAALSAACTGNSPTAPAAPVVPSCQQHNTGTLVLTNNAVTLTPRDVYLDGASIGTLPFGSQFTREVSAGVAHPVVFRSTIGGGIVSSASPIVVQCSSYALNNTF